MMEDSRIYIQEKAIDLLGAIFLLDGSLASRLEQVESSALLYLLNLTPQDPKLKEEFDEMERRWLDDVKPEMDEFKVSEYGRALLSLILKAIESSG